jgi:hypothetical protein
MERVAMVSVTNQQVTEHAFLQGLYADDYFPDQVVDKGKAILLRLCERIELSARRIWRHYVCSRGRRRTGGDSWPHAERQDVSRVMKVGTWSR